MKKSYLIWRISLRHALKFAIVLQMSYSVLLQSDSVAGMSLCTFHMFSTRVSSLPVYMAIKPR
jgi:hypothetical protein